MIDAAALDVARLVVDGAVNAWSRRCPWLGRDEIEQAAWLAALEAARTHGRSGPFDRYARRAVWLHLARIVRRARQLERQPESGVEPDPAPAPDQSLHGRRWQLDACVMVRAELEALRRRDPLAADCLAAAYWQAAAPAVPCRVIAEARRRGYRHLRRSSALRAIWEVGP